MRILMTGMAARGIGSTRVRHHITSLPDVLARALAELGHDVDGPRRVPLFGSLSSDDYPGVNPQLVMVQVGWVSSLSSTYAHEAGDAIDRCRMLGIPVLRYVDDWRSQWLADDIAGHVGSDKGWERHVTSFRKEAYGDLDDAHVEDIREALYRALEEPLLVPIMGWGNPDLFDVSTKARLAKVVPLDPQSLCDQVETRWAPDEWRARQWVLASLQEHDRWLSRQGITWPVEILGQNRKLPGGVPMKGGKNAVVPEPDVLQRYAESWGVLSPEYESAGSGYWRTRWDQAMGAGAILWPGKTDAEAIGGPFLEARPENVEALTVAGLADLARAQAEVLDGHKWSREQALSELDRIVRAAWMGTL